MMTQLPLTAQPTPGLIGSADNVPHRLVVKAAKSTLPAFLARLRGANPGARFAMSEANIALLGSAPDIEAHRRLRDDEALILETS